MWGFVNQLLIFTPFHFRFAHLIFSFSHLSSSDLHSHLLIFTSCLFTSAQALSHLHVCACQFLISSSQFLISYLTCHLLIFISAHGADGLLSHVLFYCSVLPAGGSIDEMQDLRKKQGLCVKGFCVKGSACKSARGESQGFVCKRVRV